MSRLENTIDNPELNEPATELDGEGSIGGVHNSPDYNSSLSSTSEHRDDYVHVDLPYPSEIPDDIHPSDSASESRPRSHRRHTTTSSRAHPRPRPQPQRQDLEPAGYRHRDPPPDSPESVDSAEDYVGGPPYRPNPPPRPVYYGGGHGPHLPLPYAPSNSSGASYPPVPGPPSNQMVHYGAAAPAPYGPHYPPMGVPPPAGYPPPAQPYPMSHHSGSHVGSPPFGVPPPFAGQPMMPYAPAPGYFPPQYPAVFAQPPPWDPYQRFRQSPAPPPPNPPPPPAPAPAPAQPPPAPAPQQHCQTGGSNALGGEERA
ncbi:hypothetical protein EPUS_06929 [Endocarpon pusillum Z07020]|uniref:Uncharacterized protein n=1 Tax=Endocarpon pusillum (strain Z07020 / HMAS-L-300199) TaxID=1263415 RepID=U1G813_ENDPU|nr:uncharacterized protein EPUS_06929 [Endocarpon pusillum Z07020]ERF68118.1 hypothetical protein EPUS_06929 [Endocarpon pusillum Z07020]